MQICCVYLRKLGIAVLNGLRKEKKGSVTPEASLGLFLLFVFFVTVLYFYQIMILEMRIQSALEETAQIQSAFCIAGEIQKDDVSTLGCELSKSFAYANLLRILTPSYLEHSWVEDDVGGISMNNSQLLEDGQTIRLVANYRIQVPMIPGIHIQVSQQAARRLWIGDNSGSLGSGSGETGDAGQSQVYITTHGVAYHLYEDCSYIDVKVTAVKKGDIYNLRNENGGIYYPCECCKPSSDQTVYITKYGTRYHSTAGCSAIERDVQAIGEHEVGERHLCKKCQKRKELDG